MASGAVALNVQGLVASSLDLESPQSSLNLSSLFTLTDGSGDSKFQQMFSDTRSTDQTGETLDLVGSLKNAFGLTISFSKIKVILVLAAAANTVAIRVGAAATNQFVAWCGSATDYVTIRPGGLMLLVAQDATGYATAGGSTDNLKIVAASTATVSYDIVVLGEGTAA